LIFTWFDYLQIWLFCSFDHLPYYVLSNNFKFFLHSVASNNKRRTIGYIRKRFPSASKNLNKYKDSSVYLLNTN
jgi:hypothetical protein